MAAQAAELPDVRRSDNALTPDGLRAGLAAVFSLELSGDEFEQLLQDIELTGNQPCTYTW